MAVTLSPTAVEKLAQVRSTRKSVTFVSAAGLKVTQIIFDDEVVHRLLPALEVKSQP